MRSRNPRIEIFAKARALRAAVFSALFVFALVPSASGQGAEAVTWARANNCASIRAYLSQYPGGRYVSEARAALRAKSCPDPEAEARRRAEREAAERARLENETRDLRDRLAREEAARRAAETRAADEARKRVAAETTANAAKQKATAPSTTAPRATTQTTYDSNALHPTVRAAVSAARSASARANDSASRARSAAATARQGAVSAPETGYGVYTSTSGQYVGDSYAGMFQQRKYSGPGVYIWGVNTNNTSRGDRYEGDFATGSPTGVGVKYWHNGTRYAGEMQNWYRTGHGVQTWSDGQRYEGQWGASGTYHGYGVMWTSQGRVSQSGYWTEGVLTSALAGPGN